MPRKAPSDHLQGEALWGIQRARLLVREFRKLHIDMSAGTMEAYLTIAANPGISVGGLAEKLGCSGGGASRYVSLLGDWDRKKNPGYGLVEAREDPIDRRYRGVYLTEKGRRMAEDIGIIIEGGREHGDKAAG